jgi:hypothetical protein
MLLRFRGLFQECQLLRREFDTGRFQSHSILRQ